MWIVYSTAAVFAGFVLDLLFGDPSVWWHPVCLIGKLIAKTENFLRGRIAAKAASDVARYERLYGVFLTISVVFTSMLVPSVLLILAYLLHPIAGIVVESLFCWFLLAVKCLYTESMKVYAALEKDGLEAGRYAVSMIVGRNTENLTEEGVVKAAVETVAENTSDGVIAPLFYMLIGGAVLGFFYKSINTLDSMTGYKNEKYINFGRFSAKSDDAVNFIPARISAVFMILAAFLLRFNYKNAVKIFLRDRRKHASPNSANTESVMAGALEIQLAGNAVYFDKLCEKPFIGDAIRPIERSDIEKSGRIMICTSVLFAAAGFVLKGLILLCINMAGIFIAM